MRILHVYRTYFPSTQGGLEETIRQICLNTRNLGMESRIFTLSPKRKKAVVRIDDSRVYVAKQTAEIASCGVSFEAIPYFRKLAAWADIIHYHHPWPFADILHFAARIEKPTVLTYHSDIVRQRILGRIYAPLMNRFLASMDKIVCTSENYFATSEVLPRFADKVEVVPIGVNEESYPVVNDQQIEEVEALYGRDFFLFVGVLRYYKGLHILLEAIRNAPYRVIIVGAGPIEQSLKRRAEELGLTNVVFTGYLPDATKVSLFKLCRGVVFPSYMRAEAFGVTLLEGALYGKPLISTEIGSGTSHINVDGKTGLVVTPGSTRSLREAMDQLHFRPEMAKLMGKRARERYEKLFTGALMGSRYAGIYEKLCPGKRVGATAVAL